MRNASGHNGVTRVDVTRCAGAVTDCITLLFSKLTTFLVIVTTPILSPPSQ